ncbi:MAG: Usg family protein [Alphaproteobacteria bacterium]|nr:Usg family protein [Alphaproteobacteria bacterium]
MDATHSDLRKQLRDYRLTTAEIIYHLPDHPSLLQSYIWQELDIAPRFPVLHKFLRFWETKLEGKLYMVKVASQELIKPSEFRYFDGEFVMH